ncbi:MAG: hypothetical protein OHK0046_20590 [Anaerolineae bacterium]
MTRISSQTRRQVRQRAGGRCEYCGKPEAFSAQSHHVDHIVSQKHNGTDAPDNLAWACFQCNLCKGSDIASLDRLTGDLTPLFNPRTQVWLEHFSYEGPVIVAKTATGRVTLDLLQINHPDQIETRRLLMDADLW